VGTFVRSWSWREQEADWGIYSKELSAALQALSAALDLYPGHNVHMYIDNTAVIHTLAHWYSRVHFWNPYLLSMHGKLRESHTTVVQEYVHTSANRADVLSRQPWETPMPVHISEYRGHIDVG